jgi:choline dehydrogenase-like flavoprotein
MQGYFSDQFFDDEILLETFWAPPSVIAMMLGGRAGEHLQYMEKYGQLAGSGAMIRDTSSGEVKLNGASQIEVFYDLNDEDLERLTRAWYHTIEVMFAAGAQKVIALNQHRTIFENWEQVKEFYSKHPRLDPDIIGEGNHGQGTCRMGFDQKTSVVDEYGRSHDVGNLWILDSSIFPDSLGVNPQITIMALALRGATKLFESLG